MKSVPSQMLLRWPEQLQKIKPPDTQPTTDRHLERLRLYTNGHSNQTQTKKGIRPTLSGLRKAPDNQDTLNNIVKPRSFKAGAFCNPVFSDTWLFKTRRFPQVVFCLFALPFGGPGKQIPFTPLHGLLMAFPFATQLPLPKNRLSFSGSFCFNNGWWFPIGISLYSFLANPGCVVAGHQPMLRYEKSRSVPVAAFRFCIPGKA